MLLLPGIAAMGLTSPFFGDYIEMYKGERMISTFILQNMVGDEDITVKVTVTEGNNIARIADKKEMYRVPFGRKDIPVNIEITIPENAEAEYPVKFIINQIADEGKGLSLALALEKRFTVRVLDGVRQETNPIQTEPVAQPVVEAPARQYLNDQNVRVIGTLLIVIIIYFMYRLVKKHKKKYNLV